MKTVREIEEAIMKLSPEELKKVRAWLEDFVEDQLEFTPAFEAEIQASEAELAAAKRPRIRRPGGSTGNAA